MQLPQMEPVMQQMNVLNEMGLPQDHVQVAMVYVVHVSMFYDYKFFYLYHIVKICKFLKLNWVVDKEHQKIVVTLFQLELWMLANVD